MVEKPMFTRSQVLFFQALALVLLGLFMTGLYLLMTGFSEEFGLGLASGLVLGIGMVALLSKTVREMD